MTKMLRLQHPGFGKEIRGAEKEVQGIVIDELDALAQARGRGESHPSELTMRDCDGLRYLQIYKRGFSIRVYFIVVDNVLWMVALNSNKRKTRVNSDDTKSLKNRVKEVRSEAEKRKQTASRDRSRDKR